MSQILVTGYAFRSNLSFYINDVTKSVTVTQKHTPLERYTISYGGYIYWLLGYIPLFIYIQIIDIYKEIACNQGCNFGVTVVTPAFAA